MIVQESIAVEMTFKWTLEELYVLRRIRYEIFYSYSLPLIMITPYSNTPNAFPRLLARLVAQRAPTLGCT
jgi:hypothetical protein